DAGTCSLGRPAGPARSCDCRSGIRRALVVPRRRPTAAACSYRGTGGGRRLAAHRALTRAQLDKAWGFLSPTTLRPPGQGRRFLFPRRPAPRALALLVERGLEDRSRQRRLNVQRAGAGVAKAVLAAGRDEHGLTGAHGCALVLDPEFRLA